MPMVVLIAVIVITGCGFVMLVAYRSRQQAGPQSRSHVPQPDQANTDSIGAYGAWQVAELMDSDPAPALSNTVYPDAPTRDDRPADDENACRIEREDPPSFDVERDDPPTFDVERDDSCSTDSGSDSSSDSSSSD